MLDAVTVRMDPHLALVLDRLGLAEGLADHLPRGVRCCSGQRTMPDPGLHPPPLPSPQQVSANPPPGVYEAGALRSLQDTAIVLENEDIWRTQYSSKRAPCVPKQMHAPCSTAPWLQGDLLTAFADTVIR